MPDNAPVVKRAAVVGYGAEVITCESTQPAREAAAAAQLKVSSDFCSNHVTASLEDSL